MGLFDQFFKKKEILQESVKVSDLNSWFDKKSIPIKENTIKGIKGDLQDFSDELNTAKTKINNLKEASLDNENIPKRELDIMAGNKDRYHASILSFITELELPAAEDLAAVKLFVPCFRDSITLLNKSTTKNYYILQHFFSNETRDIALQLKKMDKITNRIEDKLNSEEMTLIDEINKSISKLSSLLDKKIKSDQEISEKTSSLSEIKPKIDAETKRINELKKSSLHRDYLSLNEDKQELTESTKSLESEIIHKFAILEKSLKKFKRGKKSKNLIESYLEDAPSALIKDKKLGILPVLKQIKKEISEGAINLKDKKKDKTLSEIGQIDQELLTSLQSKYQDSISQLARVEDAITNHESLQNLKELEYTRDNLLKKEEELNEELSNTKEILSEEFYALKQQILDNLKKLLSIEVQLE